MVRISIIIWRMKNVHVDHDSETVATRILPADKSFTGYLCEPLFPDDDDDDNWSCEGVVPLLTRAEDVVKSAVLAYAIYESSGKKQQAALQALTLTPDAAAKALRKLLSRSRLAEDRSLGEEMRRAEEQMDAEIQLAPVVAVAMGGGLAAAASGGP